jgi:hypothetical protein
MTRIRRVAIAMAVVAALTLATLAGCTSSPAATGPRPITAAESQVLAVVRFKNFDAGTRSFTTSLHDSGAPLSIAGWVDYASSVGYALVSDSGAPADLLLWNDTVRAARTVSSDSAAAPLPPPDTDAGLGSSWQSAPLVADRDKHPLLVLLAVLVALGNDRPDNPLLLRQGGALWLRTDNIGATRVTVFAGPTSASSSAVPPSSAQSTPNPDASNTRYWVDKSGLLLRLEVRLGVDWVTVDFGSSSVHIDDPFATVQ